MKVYAVSIWSKVNPSTGKYCRPFLIRTCRVYATSIARAGSIVFCGATETVGRISESGSDNFLA